ncbi:uncharacterized protein LOC111914655 [Lactuca sativa]|uniref:uncharacterized protein LOC111914655 n=1 Tax=Lactuca sativa TaxID=4236 RepID=UPI000CD88B9A|nr:uncharacterized protein LOC111914655 [Lactuca sativa]
MAEYCKFPPKEPRLLTPEQQAALDVVEKPANRGKRASSKKETTEGDSSKPAKSRKRKSAKDDSSKPKKIKKMAKKSKTPSPSGSDHNEEDDKEEIPHHESPRGNTPPQSPTPTHPLNDKIPSPPLSPSKTTVPLLVAPTPPPTTSQTTAPPPVSTIPVSITPLPPPIISHATTTTTTQSTVNVNVSDTGANIETVPPVTSKPLSPTPSSDSNPILGGAKFEFDSTYYSPYRIPSEEDEYAPTTKKQIDSIHETLDLLIDSTKKYNDVALKSFMDTSLH